MTAKLDRPAALVAASLLFVAINLRPAIVAVSPLLPDIRASDRLSPSVAGLLTTLPLLCFGAFAFLTPRLSRRLNGRELLVWVLVVLVGAMGVRLVPGAGPLLVGTTIAGAALAVGNVVLPGLIKAEFPDQLALMTGLYAMTLSAGAALAAGIAVPLTDLAGAGWRVGLALWAVPALLALGALALRGRSLERDPVLPAALGVTALLRDPVALAVTGFWGLQSLEFYAAITWLPTILQGHGMSPAASGWIVSYMSIVSFPSALFVPLIARRLHSPAPLVVASVAVYLVALIGLLADPVHLVYLLAGLLGVVQGASLSLALGFIAHRARDPRQVEQLSTLAQGGGYLFAATGPVLVGALHELAGSWTLPLALLAALLALELVAGLLASRDRVVLARAGALVTHPTKG